VVEESDRCWSGDGMDDIAVLVVGVENDAKEERKNCRKTPG
jgi:hypothetical protein